MSPRIPVFAGESALVGLPHREVSAILNSLPDPILFLGIHGRVVAANMPALEMLEYSPQEIMDIPLEALLPKKAMAALIIQKMLQEGRFSNFHTSLLSRTGRAIPVSLCNTTLYDSSHRPAGIVLIAKDYRETDNLYQVLVQSSKMAVMGQMAAGIAHEINNPLQGILGLAELLGETLPEENLPDIRQIRQQALRCKYVVQRLLGLSRKQSDVAWERVQLNALIETTLIELTNELKLDLITPELHLNSDLPVVWTDPHQLQQVLLNLFVNACKAMPSGGKLIVRTAAKDCRLLIEVEDTGEGIPAGDLEKLFDPFFTTRPAGQGLGLGLSLSQMLTRNMGGEIEVQSTPGVGSIFKVVLPFVHPDVEALAWDAFERSIDRRSSERVRCEIEVSLADLNEDTAILCQDIGAGGLRVTLPQGLSSEKEYCLSVTLSDKRPLKVWSRVAWQRYLGDCSLYDTGFQFLRIEEETRLLLSSLIQEKLAQGAPLVSRRRYVRVPRLLFVQVSFENGDEVTSGLVIDLNGTGAKIFTPLNFSHGASLVLHVELESDKFHALPCTVRWSTLRMGPGQGSRYLHGVEFDRFTPELHTLVESYLKDRATLREVDLLEGLSMLLGSSVEGT